MTQSPPLKKHWVLTQEAFDKLLACLDPNRERAGEKLEQIRRSLLTFFECRGVPTPDEQADETTNRVARRLAEGKEIYVEKPAGYFYGVARNVLKEYWESAAAAIKHPPPAHAGSEDPDRFLERRSEKQRQERRLDCLQQCLQALPSDTRALISRYYQGEAGGSRSRTGNYWPDSWVFRLMR